MDSITVIWQGSGRAPGLRPTKVSPKLKLPAQEKHSFCRFAHGNQFLLHYQRMVVVTLSKFLILTFTRVKIELRRKCVIQKL